MGIKRRPLLNYINHPDYDSIAEWVDQHGRDVSEVMIEEGVIPRRDRQTLKHWLSSKINIEGLPDMSTVDYIGESGKIRTPVVIDSDREYVLAGRHRLAAALKYNLDCPVLDIIF